jgi:penicillin-binding protein 1A
MNPKRLFKYLVSREGSIFVLKVLGIGLAVMLVLVLSIFAYFRKDLPKNITDLKTCSQGASTTYYDRTGKTLLWASSGSVECYPVPMDQINQHLVNAVVAVEDKDFYQHGGFSMGGVARAALTNLTGAGTTQGGSTITQQFVKNSLLSQERTITRKMKELILSIELERTYSKKEILNAYLNEISFGSVYDGAEAASRGYFNKSAKDLTLDESALLAAVIPAPTYYSPYGEHTDELLSRQKYVLDLMVRQGYIKKEEAVSAKKVKTLAKLSTSHNKYKDILAPHFVLEVQQRLEKEYGVSNVHKAGFKVTTTVDLNKQKIAEQAIADNIYKVERDGGDNAALVSIDVQTGQVLAEVGSRSFNHPKYGELNVATTPRSPGSSFKPYDYAGLMTHNKNWGAGSIFYDLNTDFGFGYRPKNYDFREPGATSMRYSLGGSRNIPAIKAMHIAGVQNVIDTAKKMGVVSGTSCEPDCGLSAAIGDGSEIRLDEHTNAFATFARMGKYKPITYILKIQDKKGKTIKEWKDTPGQQVLDPQVAYIMNNMLSDDNARYIRGSRNFNYRGVTTALKTGTTNNMDNGWLMMYSTKIATGVWIGHHENKALWCGAYGCMEGKTGAIMASYMPKAHEGVAGSADKWEKPAGVKTVCINPISGYATASGGKCDIFPSWYNPRYPGSTQKVTIDTVSKKLATECTPEAAKQVITGGGLNVEVPSSDWLYKNFLRPIQARYGAGGGAIPSDKDDIHSCDPADKPSITIEKDSPYEQNDKFHFVARIAPGKYPTKTVNFSIDGNILSGGSIDVSSGSKEVKYAIGISAFTGTKTLTVNVIDDVLYDTSASIDINFQAPSPTTINTNNQNGAVRTAYISHYSNNSGNR